MNTEYPSSTEKAAAAGSSSSSTTVLVGAAADSSGYVAYSFPPDSPMGQAEARCWAAARRDPATGLPVCGNCGRLGHPLCGEKYMVTLRSTWLRVPEEQVAKVPHSFEDPGPLQVAMQSEIGPIREISDGEVEDLEDCLDAVQRPYPRLRKSIPLGQAVHYAEALWEVDD
eukprot:TRINITY_DN62979_c0_g1_i1.p1 TRINITY_DN62979_c0_g1~~TRINITY_DN62979_c0_g1_i1.p1  ORF type:complete len:170 (+),score=28.43 TRINITY_DN62979_c0_g1_i1:281-790(+)